MKRLFNLIYIICVIIFIIGELRSPWLIVVFLAGTVVKYRLTRDVLVPMDQSSQSPYAWLYDHARLWAKGHHLTRNPLKCRDCRES